MGHTHFVFIADLSLVCIIVSFWLFYLAYHRFTITCSITDALPRSKIALQQRSIDQSRKYTLSSINHQQRYSILRPFFTTHNSNACHSLPLFTRCLLHTPACSPYRDLPRELRMFRNDAGSHAHPIKEVQEQETITHKAAQFAKEEAKMIERATNSAKKKPMLIRVKDELVHYWHGTKLLGLEIKISTKFLYRLLKGEKLTRREVRQVCVCVSVRERNSACFFFSLIHYNIKLYICKANTSAFC